MALLSSEPRPKIDLVARRDLRRLSREAAARSMRITTAALRRAEEGRAVSADVAKKISDFYGISPRDWHPKLRRNDD